MYYRVYQGLWMAFIVKNIATKILFACIVGWLDSSTTEKKIKAQALKYSLSGLLSARAPLFARMVIRATILGTLCNILMVFVKSFWKKM